MTNCWKCGRDLPLEAAKVCHPDGQWTCPDRECWPAYTTDWSEVSIPTYAPRRKPPTERRERGPRKLRTTFGVDVMEG